MQDSEQGNICQRLWEGFGDLLTWKWDPRFGTVLAEFPPEKKESVLEILDQHLVKRWDSGTIGEAPEVAQRVNRHLGGLMAGQLLLLSDPGTEPLVYCAWWPWGNGQTVSIRIGLFSATRDAEKEGAQTEALKGWFGV